MGEHAAGRIEFQTSPDRYRHWRIETDGEVASLIMDVDPAGGLSTDYELKLNSYDLAVDIELNDAIQRLRFEHPEVRAVVVKSGKDNVFCAGANIRMLGKATHGHKVNFCKFTNETRLSIEDASENSKQIYLTAVNGTAAGGGYELALATDWIMLVDDRRSTVSLPETPLLAVLPGTGGITRSFGFDTGLRRVRPGLTGWGFGPDVAATAGQAVKLETYSPRAAKQPASSITPATLLPSSPKSSVPPISSEADSIAINNGIRQKNIISARNLPSTTAVIDTGADINMTKV